MARGVDPSFPIAFDLTRDQPKNQITKNRMGPVHPFSYQEPREGLGAKIDNSSMIHKEIHA